MTNCPRCGTPSAAQARFCAACGAARGEGADSSAVRKHVIVLFVDIVGSTSVGEHLDPESLRGMLQRYFDVVSAVLWRYGGTVEKFIGDAVMAVFGVPVAREDDARRALDAALEVHASIADLSTQTEREFGTGLRVRIGVNGGEVFASRHADGQYAVTGDPVNVAARLQQSAEPGETLVGGTVAHLVGAHAPLRPIRPLVVRGRSAALPIWRLDPTVGGGSGAAEPEFVGRREELADLNRLAERVTARWSCCLVTVLGSTGIGKSRLVAEFVGRLPGVRVLKGQCLSYAAGATYWPLAEVLEQLGDDWREQLEILLGGGRDASLATERLAAAVGRSSSTTSLDDIVWAARRLTEALAQDRPLVLIWEDLQWAEPTFLEFLARLSARLRTVPVLMLCLAHPELLELYPAWGGGHDCSMSLTLGPLPPDSVQELVGELTAHGGPDLEPSQVVALSEGNPLIVRQMLEATLSRTSIPMTVQTLFEARLDRLDPADRLYCEQAAVMGREFWPEAVSGSQVEVLDRLVRIEVLEPTRARNRGRPSHRFTHALLRETVYRSTPKARRSHWHHELARWLPSAGGLSEGEREELLAFHLVTAHGLLTEISGDDDRIPGLAAEAAAAAVRAGSHCLARSDLPAAAKFLEQARALLPPGDPRHTDAMLLMIECLLAMGAYGRAMAALDQPGKTPDGDGTWPILARLLRTVIELRTDSAIRGRAYDVARSAISALAPEGATRALTWAHELEALAYVADLKMSAAETSLHAALAAARATGDRRAESRILCGLCELVFWGPTPVAEARELCHALLPRIESDLRLTAPVLAVIGGLAALEGNNAAATALVGRAMNVAEELDLTVTVAGLRQFSGIVAALGGDHRGAAGHFAAGAAVLGEHDAAAAATLTLAAARSLLESGEEERAAAAVGDDPGAGPPLDDPHFQALWYGLASKLALGRGDTHLARSRALRGVEVAERTEDPRGQGDALTDLALAHQAAGDHPAAAEALRAAVERYERKGAIHCARTAKARFSGAT